MFVCINIASHMKGYKCTRYDRRVLFLARFDSFLLFFCTKVSGKTTEVNYIFDIVYAIIPDEVCQ